MSEQPLLADKAATPKLGQRIATLVIFGFLGLLLASYMTAESGAQQQCIFCSIVAGQMPHTRIERETDDYVIFKDIKPASTHHYLAVTKRHIDSVRKLTARDEKLVLSMAAGLKEFYTAEGVNVNETLFGFHLPPFISVRHLHMHAIAPRSEMNFFNRLMFRPNSMWFRTVEQALLLIRENQE